MKAGDHLCAVVDIIYLLHLADDFINCSSCIIWFIKKFLISCSYKCDIYPCQAFWHKILKLKNLFSIYIYIYIDKYACDFADKKLQLMKFNENYWICLQNNIRDKLTPIDVSFSYRLVSDDEVTGRKKRQTAQRTIPPILDKYIPSTVTVEVGYPIHIREILMNYSCTLISRISWICRND